MKKPQPLYFRGPGATAIFGMEAFDKRPILAIKFAKAIATWAQVELQMLNLIMRMLNAKRPEDIADFATLNSTNAILNRLRDMEAKVKRPEEHRVLFYAILEMTSAAYVERNRITHRIWGTSSGVPNGLVLADPDDLLESTLQLMQTINDPTFDLMKFHHKSLRRISVYEEPYFDWLISHFLRISELLFHLGFVMPIEMNWRDEQCQRLSNEPDVREALSRVQISQKSSPAVPPSPPQSDPPPES
jgi:hypothetical protein